MCRPPARSVLSGNLPHPGSECIRAVLAEGYFESRKGAGTFVSESLPESLTICEQKTLQTMRRVQGRVRSPVALCS